MRIDCLAIALLLWVPVSAAAQASPDHEGVRQGVLDYVEGFYEVDKFGFWRGKDGAYKGGPFPWAQFFGFASRVRSG